MKIAVTGAHRVGKTTLAEKLSGVLEHYVYYQEPYYDLEERGYVFAETPTIDDFLTQLERSQKLLATKDKDVVFDRCPLDLLAYIGALNGGDQVRNLYDRVQHSLAVIDLLVWVPIETPDLIGCPNNEFPALRQDVNAILEEWLDDIDVPKITVKGSLPEREKQVLSKMKLL
ncbi:ATP-binding protein [Paraflavitalea sp. CAU 1676]|uniref:ATP/GTP-binding protein n=1 Tax=Paraflavitalea sp. CAU 1676 TaxID=3032598 RepID=UPI0023DC96D3|nr:ATP-binding protein [Paraflavitalea sp. CAU 1676]MDF2188443.1 ATP-binding protein [Paraflavitalea sp. CAU 1676]